MENFQKEFLNAEQLYGGFLKNVSEITEEINGRLKNTS